MKKITALVLAIVLCLALVACGAQPANQSGEPETNDEWEGITLKLSTNLSSVDACTIELNKVADEIKTATDGKVVIEVYPNGELLTYAEAVEAINSDSNVIYYCGPSDWADYCQNAVILACPSVFDSIDQEVAFQESEVFQSIMGDLESKGIYCLQPGWIGGYRNIMCNKEITCLDDLKGLTIRVPDTVAHEGMASALGMNPAGMAWSDTLTAASQGSIDAAEGTWGTITSYSCWDYFKYVVMSRHILQAECLWMSTNVWESIPEEYRAIISEKMSAGQLEYVETVKTNEDALRAQAEEAGMTVIDLDLTEFKEAGSSVCTQFELGQQVLDTLKEIPA